MKIIIILICIVKQSVVIFANCYQSAGNFSFFGTFKLDQKGRHRIFYMVLFTSLLLSCHSKSLVPNEDESSTRLKKSNYVIRDTQFVASFSNIRIDEIWFNQAVPVPLYRDRIVVEEGMRVVDGGINLSIVNERAGLFSVSFESDKPEDIVVRLVLNDGLGNEQYFSQSTSLINDAYVSWHLDSSLVFPGQAYAVELISMAEQALLARMPAHGFAELGVDKKLSNLNLTIVPIAQNGIEPSITQSVINAIHDGFLQMYPVAGVNIKLNDVLHMGGVAAEQAADILVDLRKSDNPETEQLYLGIAPLSQIWWKGYSKQKVAIAPLSEQGLDIEKTVGFAVHELGHSLGLEHTPGCDAEDVDETWPYDQRSDIINDGYGILDRKVKKSEFHYDFMNYCLPDWPSPYTFNKAYQLLTSQQNK